MINRINFGLIKHALPRRFSSGWKIFNSQTFVDTIINKGSSGKDSPNDGLLRRIKQREVNYSYYIPQLNEMLKNVEEYVRMKPEEQKNFYVTLILYEKAVDRLKGSKSLTDPQIEFLLTLTHLLSSLTNLHYIPSRDSAMSSLLSKSLSLLLSCSPGSQLISSSSLLSLAQSSLSRRGLPLQQVETVQLLSHILAAADSYSYWELLALLEALGNRPAGNEGKELVHEVCQKWRREQHNNKQHALAAQILLVLNRAAANVGKEMLEELGKQAKSEIVQNGEEIGIAELVGVFNSLACLEKNFSHGLFYLGQIDECMDTFVSKIEERIDHKTSTIQLTFIGTALQRAGYYSPALTSILLHYYCSKPQKLDISSLSEVGKIKSIRAGLDSSLKAAKNNNDKESAKRILKKIKELEPKERQLDIKARNNQRGLTSISSFYHFLAINVHAILENQEDLNIAGDYLIAFLKVTLDEIKAQQGAIHLHQDSIVKLMWYANVVKS